eukprot:g75812.t1
MFTYHCVSQNTYNKYNNDQSAPKLNGYDYYECCIKKSTHRSRTPSLWLITGTRGHRGEHKGKANGQVSESYRNLERIKGHRMRMPKRRSIFDKDHNYTIDSHTSVMMRERSLCTGRNHSHFDS